MRRRRKVILSVCLVLGLYALAYSLNSLRGGYELMFTSTFLHPVSFARGTAEPDGGAIAWQPRYGRFTRDSSDFIGKFFAPLIFLDQALWHRDFPSASFRSHDDFRKLVPLEKVHPGYARVMMRGA